MEAIKFSLMQKIL